MSDRVHLRIDLGTEDETGFPWTYLPPDAAPSVLIPGRHVIAGAGAPWPSSKSSTWRKTGSST